MTQEELLAILQKAAADSRGSVTTTTLDDYGLGGVDCEICGNTGHISYKKDGLWYGRECSCMAKRRSLRRIRKSGMEEMLRRYTFDAYETPDAERASIKKSAMQYAEEDSGWFYIAGQSGSGKTHICTAICSRLIDRGKDVYYMRWRDESRALKAAINTSDVEEPLDKLKKVQVLYIDDFLKGSANDPDIRLAFEILNARYNDISLRTVISTEMPIKKLLELDEALGGRVYERSKGYRFRAPNENWRLR